VSGVDFIER